MARQQTGETKAPIVIALVFFVLATLTLGVLTYMAYDQVSAQKAAAAEAANKEKAAVSKLSEEQARVLYYKQLVGTGTQEEFDNLKNGGKGDVVQKEHAATIEAVRNRIAGNVTREAKNFVGTGIQFNVPPEAVVQWTSLDKPPEHSMIDAVVSSYARQQLAANKLAVEQRALDQAKATYQDQFKRYQDAENAFKTLSAQFPKQIADVQAKADALVQSVRDAFKGDTSKYTADMKAKAEALTTEQIKLQDALNKANGLAKQVERLDDRAADRQDPFAYEKPHGKIVGKRGNVVDINLGSADNVRPGLTFSVQPADTPERGLQSRTRPRIGPRGQPIMNGSQPAVDVVPKGTIEVVEVLGPNLSQARITSNPDPIREAILVGDVLYNPAWQKGASDHVALFGVFDVNGDGTDDIKQVVNDLTRMGVVVDAYFDLNTKKWVGQVTEQTTFAVEGAHPVSTAGDALSAAKSALDQALQDAKTDARNKGVAVVKARTFFGRIGYNARFDVSPDVINRAFNRYLQTQPAGAGTEGGDTTGK